MNADRHHTARSSFLLGVLFIAAAGCQRPGLEDRLSSLSGSTMGTRYSVTVSDQDEGGASSLQALIDRRLHRLNQRVSTYVADSDLSRFNDSETTDWFEVKHETAVVVEHALRIAEETGGAFDPTVGPVVDLWGFGAGGRRTAPPTDAEVEATRSAVGYKRVEARLEPPALRKSHPAVRVDLSAIAKGHGVDVIGRLLTDHGARAYLVEIGGEVRTRGTKPDGSPWRIGVERADTAQGGGRPLQRVVELSGLSMATSGDYRNYFEHEGQRYSHTIDPRSGRPVTHRLATVTVVAPTCREADALATALLVMGPEQGYDWAEENRVAAMFVRRDEADQLVAQVTSPWRANLGDAANVTATQEHK